VSNRKVVEEYHATAWTKGDFENTYGYDAQSRMTSIVEQGQNLQGSGVTNNAVANKRVDFTYNALDEFETVTRRSGIDVSSPEVFISTSKYDGLGRLVGLVHQKTGQPTINSYTFGYDVINRLTSMSSKDGPSTFTYDSTSQLTSANHTNGAGLPADESYVHDLNGNRVSANGSTYATGTNNQLLSDGTYNYSYDLEGNRTGRTRISDGQYTEYRYDHHNQLVFVGAKTSASAPTYTSRVQMVYDLFGRRFQKLVDSDGDGDWDSQSGYVSDGMHVALEYKGSSLADAEFVRRYLHGPNIDQVLAQENASTNAVQWMATDHLGTIRDMTDGAGTAIVHVTFGAFGQLVNLDDPQGVPYLFGYTGREWDAETGLWYYRARYYDANTGRFLSEDPLGFAAGDTNLARYVGNGPTNYTDPTGLHKIVDQSDQQSAYWYYLQTHAQLMVDPRTGQLVPGSLRSDAPSFDQFYGNQWPALRDLIAEAQANARRRMLSGPANLPPPVDGHCGTGLAVGFLSVGKALTYPARWLGADFSRQDAALERLWYRTGLNGHWSRTATEYSAGVAATATYAAFGLQLTGAGSIPASQAGLYELELRTASWLATRPPWMTSPLTYSAIGGGTTYVLTEDPRASVEVAAVPLLLFPERASGDIASAFCGPNKVAAVPQTSVPNLARQRSALRREYLGVTPGKNSATGRAVQQRMREEGLLRDTENGVEVQSSNGNWVPIDQTDMAHTTDAVRWWNEVGRSYGARSPEVRQWMLDPNNYRLEAFGINRGNGGRLRVRYLPPINDGN
jgi:RHS repeat-associated protein